MSNQFVRLEEFGRAFIPRRVRPNLRRYLFKAGYMEVPYTVFGALFVLSLVITGLGLILMLMPLIGNLSMGAQLIIIFLYWVVANSLVLLIIIMVIYIWLDVKILKRTREMEDVLEEFLRYVSENLKGGMNFDKALWEAIRPQYGTLADEIELVAKQVMTGKDIAEALTDFTDKYNSPTLKRAFQLIVEGMKGGGNIAYIIDRVEKNIRETKELMEEMIAANTTYVIFMGAIILVIAPALFGLSYNLLMVLKTISSKVSASGGASSTSGMTFMDFSQLKIDPIAFRNFSMGALSVIALFASMILAIIQKGNVKEGLKYIPIFILISLVMYLMFKAILGALFVGMIDI